MARKAGVTVLKSGKGRGLQLNVGSTAAHGKSAHHLPIDIRVRGLGFGTIFLDCRKQALV